MRFKKLVFITFTATTLALCQDQNQSNATSSSAELKSEPTDLKRLCFPRMDIRKQLDECYVENFKHTSTPNPRAEKDFSGFRFTWLRTFDHPISIHIFHKDDVTTLHAVILDGAGGYDWGKTKKSVTRNLTQTQWLSIVEQAKSISFWDLPEQVDEPLATDGAEWFIEGYTSNSYHPVYRSGLTNDSISNFCTSFLGLSHIKIKPREIY